MVKTTNQVMFFWIFDRFLTSVFFTEKTLKNTIATCSGFHGSITRSNMRLRMFSWPICSEPIVSLGIEQNQCSAQCNSIEMDIVLQKGSTPAAYNREIYSVTWSSYRCQQKLAHRLDDSAAILSVVIRLVPIQFVAVLFMLVCFGRVRVCSRFILLHCS